MPATQPILRNRSSRDRVRGIGDSTGDRTLVTLLPEEISMRSTRAPLLLSVLVWLGACCCEPPPKQIPLPDAPQDAEEGADVVIVGRVRTYDQNHPVAGGLVIRGGVVAHVTTAERAVRYATSKTRLINVP